MFLRNFLLFSHIVKSWRSSLSFSIRRFRRFNNSLYFKCDDVERGLKHQYIEKKTYNNNENEVKTSKNNLVDSSESSNSSVYIRRGLKAVSSLLVISLASFIAFHMDNLIYGLISIFVAIVTVLFITGKWRWFYIAAVTGPRDLKWVNRYQALTLVSRYDIDFGVLVQHALSTSKGYFAFLMSGKINTKCFKCPRNRFRRAYWTLLHVTKSVECDRTEKRESWSCWKMCQEMTSAQWR